MAEGLIDIEPSRSRTDPLVHHVVRYLVESSRVAHVVGAGEAVVQSGLGRYDATAFSDVFAIGFGIESKRANQARVGAHGARHHTDGGGLAGSVGSQQHGDLATWCHHVEVIEGHGIAEELAHTGAVRRRVGYLWAKESSLCHRHSVSSLKAGLRSPGLLDHTST